MKSYSSREVIKIIEADGWRLVRVSHHHFRHPFKKGIVTVKHPDRDIPPKTLESIAKQAGSRVQVGGEMKRKLPDRYCYPAVFSYEDGKEIAVVFPDLNLATSGEDDEDAFFSARDALGGRLELMEEDGDEIPSPSKISEIQLAENERASLVDVYMPPIRMEGVTKPVRRTVTIPSWMNAKAMELNLNFSQILQEALGKRIGSVSS